MRCRTGLPFQWVSCWFMMVQVRLIASLCIHSVLVAACNVQTAGIVSGTAVERVSMWRVLGRPHSMMKHICSRPASLLVSLLSTILFDRLRSPHCVEITL